MGAGQVRRDDHSSSPGIAARIEQPTRRLRTGRPRAPPYLVLLRAGFCVPPLLPEARCALTAPFHHCLPIPKDRRQLCVFCATVRQVTLPGRYPAHCPVEFGLSSPPSTSRAVARPRLNEAAIVWPGCGASSSLDFRLQTSDDGLAVGLLRDFILLQLFVEVAARGVDQIGGFG